MSEHRALRQAEARLRALVDHSSDAIVVVAPDSTVLYEAGSPGDVLGLEAEELHGGKLCELIEPQDQPLLLTLCRTVGHEDAEVRLRGGARTVEIRATSLLEHPSWEGVVLHIWDVSDRKTLELELRLAQKLEAVGQLAAGIAHEINTPMQFIGDNTRFLEEAFGAMSTLLQRCRSGLARQDIEAARGEVERAAVELDTDYLVAEVPSAIQRTIEGVRRVSTIVRALKEFAHPDQAEMTAIDLNRTILATLEVARNEYKYVADVQTQLAEIPAVMCYPGDLSQVFLNLIVNAAHAIEQVVEGSSRRGEIQVATHLEGDHVVVAVADTGCGIPEEIRHKIFEPFFTTKDVGKGTGQGLAIAQRIVAKHKGQLTFTTQVGKGTTFFVRLPVEPAPTRAEGA